MSILDAINGKLQVILKSQSLSAVGLVKTEISFSDATGKKLSTAQFNFTVTASIDNGEGILSSNQITVIDAKLLDIQAQYNDDSTQWNSDVTNKLAEATNKINETEATRQLTITATNNANTATTNTQTAITNANNTVTTINNNTYTNPKGIKTTYALLPSSGNVLGDSWHVTSDSDTTKNGHWRWNGTAWVLWYQFNLSGVPNTASLNDIDKAKADIIRNQRHSGCLKCLPFVTGSTTNLNSFTVPADVYSIKGYEISVPSTVVTLPTAPVSGTEDVLVFLESYFPQAGNGYTLSYRIRTVSAVNFTTYPEGVNDSVNVKAWGGNSANTAYTFALDSVDKGLYVSGDGSSGAKSTLLTYDGYVYGKCIARVKRRNSSGFSPSIMGGARNWVNLPSIKSNETKTVNLENSISVTVTNGTVQLKAGDKIHFSSGTILGTIVTIDSDTIATIKNAYFNNVSITLNQVFGTNLYNGSDHPQSLYSNVIDSRDITDLRHLTQAQYNYPYLLAKNSDMFNRGELSPKKMLAVHHGIPKTEIDGNTVFYASLDGTEIAEVGGVPIASSANFVTGGYIPSITGSMLKRTTALGALTAWYGKYNISNLSSALTVDMVFRHTTSATNRTICSLQNTGGTLGIVFILNSANKLRIMDTNTAVDVTNSTTLSFLDGKDYHMRIAYSNGTVTCFVNGKIACTQTVTLASLNLVAVALVGDSGGNTSFFDGYADVSISNIDRGALFPNLPPDFISGDAQIMPAYTDQRRILSESQTTQTINSVVKATNLLNSRGINRVVIGTPNTWSANDTVTVTGMAGELISGVFDADTANVTVIKDALSTDTVIYTDSVTGLVAGDEVKLVDRVLGTVLATKTIATDGVDATLKKVTFTATLGVALSKYQVVVMESTASSSVPLAYHMVAGVKTAVVGTWATFGTNVATFTLGTNAGLTNQDVQIDYSLIMPTGQPALIAPTTTTLMGEAGFRLPYANQTITSDYVNKISGRTWENPNVAKTGSKIVANNPAPSTFTDEFVTSDPVLPSYDKIYTQDGVVTTYSTSVVGEQACILLSFDLIKIAERKLGCKIPRKTVADKVAWMYANLASTGSIKTNIWTYGSCPSGSKVYLSIYGNSTYSIPSMSQGVDYSNLSTPTKLTIIPNMSTVGGRINSDGIMNFLLYSDPASDTTSSIINVEYASLDIKFQDKIVNSYGLVTGQTVDIRDDFLGKIYNSTTENPNVAYFTQDNGNYSSLLVPSSGSWTIYGNDVYYGNIAKLDFTLKSNTTNVNLSMPQHLFSFNLIRIVEDKYGPIPAIDKVQWLKDNLLNIDFNWWGYGTNPSGNYATISTWNGVWTAQSYNTLGSVLKVSGNIKESNANVKLSICIQSDGFVHFLSWANASNGEIPSIIYTDYCNIELTFKNSLTGYDKLSSTNPRRDGGLSNILYVNKQTKEVQTMFPWSNEYNLTTYSEHLQSPTAIPSSTDVTIVSELPNWEIVDIGSSVGNKWGNHPWSNLAYKVGQDSDSLYGEMGISKLDFAEESVNLNTGSLVNLNVGGFANNYTKQYGLTAISKPMVGIGRWLVMYNSQLYLLVFSKLTSNGIFNTDNAGQAFLISLQGNPLVKMENGIVRSGVVTPTTFKTNGLVVQGFVSKATNTLITS